jgi:hypothetical protein
MEKLTKREFMARIGACAVILRSQKAEKVAQIAAEKGVTEDDVACMYVVGALKAMRRRGSAATLAEALVRYEDAQVGDRAVSVRGEAPIVAEVRRINRINEVRGSGGTTHRRNMGVVLGTIYVGWDAAIAANAPDVVLERNGYNDAVLHIDNIIASYIDEYVTRLSCAARASIRQIVASKASDDAIMSAKRGELAKLKERAKYLHHNFPHADAVTTRELIGLLRRYVA